MANLVKQEKKDPTDVMPFKGLIDDNARAVKVAELGFWLDALLGLNGEMAEKRLLTLLPMIQDFAWSLSVEDVKKAFTAYVSGKLPIEPRDNYLSAILFNKVINSWKEQRVKPKKEIKEIKMTQEQKDANVFMGVVNCFDEFIQTDTIIDGYVWVYGHLFDDLKIHTWTDDEKRAQMPIANARLIKESKDSMKLSDYKSFKRDLENNRKTSAVINMARKMLLERFFRAIHAKGKHIKDVL